MEALLPLGAGVWAALAAWLLGGAGNNASALEGVRQAKLRKEMLTLLVKLGELAPLRAIGGFGPARELVDELVASGPNPLRGLGRQEALSALAIAWMCACLFGFVSAGPVGLVVCGLAALAAGPAWAAAAKRRRADELARQVPSMFRSLAVALGAGRTLSQAVSYVGARGQGALSREFGRAALRISCGASASEALGELARRTKAPGVDLMVCALQVSARTGAPLQGLFMRSARLAERRFELERELMSKTAQVRLSARVVGVLPALLVALLALLSPDFREGLGTPVGMGSVCVAAVLDATALLVIRRLMKGVL